MLSVKQHYENHLADFYTWSLGNLRARQNSFEELVLLLGLKPKSTGVCFDLGAGSGLHSVPLARIGYSVEAIDFSSKLLEELYLLSDDQEIECIEGDIRNFQEYVAGVVPELIVCAGDTITHLESVNEVECLIERCSRLLADDGKLLLSFRDYSQEAAGFQSFIPVHSDEKRIHTCILRFDNYKVCVTDLINERRNSGWEQKVSSYEKIRLDPVYLENALKRAGLNIGYRHTIEGMVYLLGVKSSNG